jgi:hypothetical protein
MGILRKKRDKLNIKLLGRNSELSVHNKLTLYKQVIRPVWSYGIQLWGYASSETVTQDYIYMVASLNEPIALILQRFPTGDARELLWGQKSSETIPCSADE